MSEIYRERNHTSAQNVPNPGQPEVGSDAAAVSFATAPKASKHRRKVCILAVRNGMSTTLKDRFE